MALAVRRDRIDVAVGQDHRRTLAKVTDGIAGLVDVGVLVAQGLHLVRDAVDDSLFATGCGINGHKLSEKREQAIVAES